jgi:hypothetical protein
MLLGLQEKLYILGQFEALAKQNMGYNMKYTSMVKQKG